MPHNTQSLTTRWNTVAASDLCPGMLDAGRISIPYAVRPADVLPNGDLRPDRVKLDAAVCVGHSFHLLARVISDPKRGPCLQVSGDAWDLARSRRVPFSLEPALLAHLYRELGRRYVHLSGKSYRQSARN